MISVFSSKKLNFLLQAYVTSCLMTILISGVGTFVSVGAVNGHLFDLWFGAWGLSWLIAFPALAIVLALYRKYSNQHAELS